MNLRRLVAVAGIGLVMVSAVFYHSGSAAPAAKSTEQESVSIRCARAQLRLAELTLQRAQDMNKKIPGTLITGMITQFADDVEFAKLQLQSAKRAETIDPLQSCLQRTELSLRLAEAKLKKAQEVSQRAPSVVQPSDLERLRLVVEITQLRLESGRALANASPDVKLQWQMELLSDELSHVKEQTYLLGQNRLSQF